MSSIVCPLLHDAFAVQGGSFNNVKMQGGEGKKAQNACEWMVRRPVAVRICSL